MRAPNRYGRSGESLSWWLIGSLGVHGIGVVSALVGATIRPARAPEAIYTVDLEPPRGAIQGEVNGKGTPLPMRPHAPSPPSKPLPVEARRTVTEPPLEKAAKALPLDPAGTVAPPTASVPVKDLHGDALRDAVRRSMMSSEEAASPVEGTGTAPPIGVPNGAPGGTGKAKVGAAYSAVLGGWFASRLHCRGLNLPWEEMRTLNVRASISLTPDRKVANFSVNGSGNSVYDACVQGMLQSLESQGTTLPESPDGDDPPPHLNLNFHCRNKDQCS